MSEASPLSNLTPVQIKQLQRVFYALDKNADGRVSQENVAAALRSLGVPQAEEEARGCYENVPDSTYELMSFLAMMSGVLHPFADMQKLREAFESFDEKDEGYIPTDTAREILDHNDDMTDAWLVPPFVDRSRTRFDYRKFLSTLGMCEWKELVAP